MGSARRSGGDGDLSDRFFELRRDLGGDRSGTGRLGRGCLTGLRTDVGHERLDEVDLLLAVVLQADDVVRDQGDRVDAFLGRVTNQAKEKSYSLRPGTRSDTSTIFAAASGCTP